MSLPDIPKTYLMLVVIIAMVVLRCFGIDSFTTGALSLIVGYLFGSDDVFKKNL